MDLQAEKIELAKLLLETDSERIIEQVKAVFRDDGYDFYDELPQQVKDSIDAALRDIDKGKVYDYEVVMQDIKNRYGIEG